MGSLSLDQMASEAGVDPGYVERLIELGALDVGEGDKPYGPDDARRVRLFQAWERAGLPVADVAKSVAAGELSFAFLETPTMATQRRMDVTYRDYSIQNGFPLRLIQDVHVALGYAPPEPTEPVRENDLVLIELMRTLLTEGVGEEAGLRLFRVYANALRRIAKAEADLYEAEVEERLRRSGMSERELLDHGAEVGAVLMDILEQALTVIYRRHREHVWIEHSVNHGEAALEAKGLYQRLERPPCICFVDLTGFTRLTEEQGDQVAARVASNLSALVEDISRESGGWPIRWLGDGGMFHFDEPVAAVSACLRMAERAPLASLPPTHTGIHRGPVIFQDGDVYGRTVNIASRIAAQAQAGQVL
ncbi:MAG: adenylate/guanylate cyclase domain-containing protein, partial [Acidimicrobiia bacterium]